MTPPERRVVFVCTGAKTHGRVVLSEWVMTPEGARRRERANGRESANLAIPMLRRGAAEGLGWHHEALDVQCPRCLNARGRGQRQVSGTPSPTMFEGARHVQLSRERTTQVVGDALEAMPEHARVVIDVSTPRSLS